MENQNFNEKQSLQLIEEMILSAKSEIKDNGFQYLFWGWLVIIAMIAQFILMKTQIELSYLPWVILMPSGGIIAGVYGYKHQRTVRVKTWIDRIMGRVWLTFGVCLFIVLFFGFKIGWETNVYPILMLLYGMGTFLSGSLLKFKPLIIGGIVCWVLSVAAFLVSFELQMLLLVSSLLISYIIPGYLLKKDFNKNQK